MPMEYGPHGFMVFPHDTPTLENVATFTQELIDDLKGRRQRCYEIEDKLRLCMSAGTNNPPGWSDDPFRDYPLPIRLALEKLYGILAGQPRFNSAPFTVAGELADVLAVLTPM